MSNVFICSSKRVKLKNEGKREMGYNASSASPDLEVVRREMRIQRNG